MKTSLLITGGLAFGAMTFAQEKPNIIVILADDLGFSDLGCYGGAEMSARLSAGAA